MNGAALPAGTWLGVLGGGQLGRMYVHAAQALGYRVCVLDPAADSPAGMAADDQILAAYDDPAALDALAARCQAVTTEFENVPAASLERLAQRVRVTPGAHCVAIAQDRLREKAFAQSCGLPVAPHVAVHSAADLEAAPADLFPAILKAARLGYDGKGQARVADVAQAQAAFEAMGGVACVLEKMLPLAQEVSVLVARGLDGATTAWPVFENVHRGGILALSSMPARVPAACAQQATEAALAMARAMDYRGVLCVEFFVLQDGSLVVNEMAPRPHNSGHATIDACVTSQFEQQARVMAGLPLGDTRALCPAVLVNVLGDVWYASSASDATRDPDWAGALAHPRVKLHLYGKTEARRARKMGHITVLDDSLEAAHRVAAQIEDHLGIAR